jgi:proteasome lid subunit RPN8/RPN11
MFLDEQSRLVADHLADVAVGDDGEALDEACDIARRLLRIRVGVAILTRVMERVQGSATYLVGARFLRSAAKRLTRTRFEDLVYVTGPEAGTSIFALTTLVSFDLDRSTVHATPIIDSQRKALASLENSQERLLATLHSHPGRGAKCTSPSDEDLSTQARLERSEYPTIGGIVSRDGFLRFYAVDRVFRVAVSGAGITQIDERLFHLDIPKANVTRRRAK